MVRSIGHQAGLPSVAASAFNPLQSSGGTPVFEVSARSRVNIPQRVNVMTPSREER